MKNRGLIGGGLVACSCLCLSLNISAQKTVTWYGQTFKIDTLYPSTGSSGMNTPWELVYGPDDSLWVTESHNYRIWKIHPSNKGVRLLSDLNSERDFSDADAGACWPQGGLMGLAIHPDFYSGKPWVYIAYVYHQVSPCSGGSGSYYTKIVRCRYNIGTGVLSIMDTVISGLHGSNDHNSGRVRISPQTENDGQYHLYYTIGDMGAGNLANSNRPNHAQDTTILEGKILRLNTEPDNSKPLGQRWIPGDNPFPAGAASSAKNPIYSFGHRNPQGLVFGSVNGGATYILYSSEHGDKSDDEVNIILPHSNYGWPKMAGLCDDNYTSTINDSMYLASKAVISETGFCDTTRTTLREPIFSFYNWSRNPNKTAGAKGNSFWPTIAPSSIAFYGAGNIPGWNYSLLIPSLKNGMFRLKLKPDGLGIDSTQTPTDTLHYFPGYRLRNVTVAPAGDTLFVSVDNSCCALDASGTLGSSVPNPAEKGFILRMIYLTPLALTDTGKTIRNLPPENTTCKVYPNPADRILYIRANAGEHKPLVAGLYDIMGNAVLVKPSSQDHFSLDIHGLIPGIYIFRLLNGYAVPLLTEKIIVK